MKQKPLRITVVMSAAIFMWISGISLAADYRPAMLANPCAGCHGTDGASPGSIPSIKGLPSSHLISVMKAFKSGKRKGTVMNRIARGYTDEEIELMAKHFSSAK
jgi:sulfide dehydrogenase cytochrome subunit